MSTVSEAIALLEYHSKKYAEARALVAERASLIEAEIADVLRRKLPGMRAALATAADHQAKLVAAVDENRALFVKPRTMTLHGIKFGLAKGKGAIEWTVEDHVLAERIEKMFKGEDKLLEQLIKTTKKPIAKALKELEAAELAKLGVTVEATGDYVFVKAADTEADALVKKLLTEGNVEELTEAAS